MVITMLSLLSINIVWRYMVHDNGHHFSHAQAKSREETRTKMANIIVEQFEDLYSKWSLLDKVGKDAQLAEMMGRAQGLYPLLVMNYGRKGFLTHAEYNQVEQIRQIGQFIQARKMQADQDLWNEMMKHLAKMIVKI